MDSGTNAGIHGGAACSLQLARQADVLHSTDNPSSEHASQEFSFMILDNSRKRKRSLADDVPGENANLNVTVAPGHILEFAVAAMTLPRG